MPSVTGDGICRSKNASTFNSEDSTDSDFSTCLKLYATSDHTSIDSREPSTSFGNLEVADPDYVDFLKHLKDYGNAYALEISQDNGGSELLVYEALLHETVEHRPTKGRLRDSLNIINETVSRNKKAKTLGVPNDTLGFELVEQEVVQEDEQHPKIKKKSKNSEQVNEVSLTSDTNLVPRRSLRSNDQTKEPKGSKVLEVEEKDLRQKNVNSVSHWLMGCSNQKRGQDNTNNIREISDSCYQEFINNLHMEGDYIVYVKANGKMIRYGECDDVDNDVDKDESSSDVEIIENHAESVMEGDDDLQWQPIDNSELREKLMLELKRPYDQDEYEKLLDDVNEQKPRSKHTDIRVRSTAVGGDGREVTGKIMSLQNHTFRATLIPHRNYADLDAQLKSVQFERPKVLNILRGFFFWLQQILPTEGGFKPWADPSCLDVLPEIL